MITKIFCILSLIYILAACTNIPVAEQTLGPKLTRDQWDQPSVVQSDLVSLPSPRGKIVASVYSFRDLTGQYKTAPSSSFSTAVSQGAASMLVKAIKDSGWFAPLEREGLQDLLTERKIIRASLKNKNSNFEVPPLLGANILFEGGIIGYETNMKTGGAGAKYFGTGVSEQYRVDQVTVNLRVVDVQSGRVINSITTSRSILSRQVQGGAFRFVRFKRLLEMEAGYTRNEPVQLCLSEAIQDAVMRAIAEGIEDNSWSLADNADIDHPLLFKYGTRTQASTLIVKEEKKADEKNPIEEVAATAKEPAPNSLESQEPQLANTREESTEKNPFSAESKQEQAPVKTVTIASTPVENKRTPVTTETIRNLPKMTAGKSPKKKAPHTTKLAQKSDQGLVLDKDGNWVIQLMSSSSSLEIIKFARTNKLPRDMIEYIHYKDNGSDRFAILYGRFHDKDRAIKAIDSLPPRLRIFEPYVKAMSSVKKVASI